MTDRSKSLELVLLHLYFFSLSFFSSYGCVNDIFSFEKIRNFNENKRKKKAAINHLKTLKKKPSLQVVNLK